MISESERRQLLRDQALGSVIQRHIRDVIRAAAKTVQRLRPEGSEISGMRESQLRNVVNAAISAQSVEEVAAFILYQMGRSTNRRQWLYGAFGDEVVRDLLQGDVREVSRQAREQALAMLRGQHIDLNEEEQKTLFDQIHLALARQYLGYLNRIFYFADRTDRWGGLSGLYEEGAT